MMKGLMRYAAAAGVLAAAAWLAMDVSARTVPDAVTAYDGPPLVLAAPKPLTLRQAVDALRPTLEEPIGPDHRCLAQAIYFEARSEPLDGQLAVAQVVLNRVRNAFYPATICEVVFQNEHLRHRCQFSFACDGRSDRPRNKRAWDNARLLATIALIGGWSDLTQSATHYHADYVAPHWKDAFDHTAQYGRHLFYRSNRS